MENLQKNVRGGVSVRAARIKITAYYRDALQIHSGSGQRKGYSKISEISKNLCENVPFFLTLQSCSPEFLTSANTNSKKSASFAYSEIVGTLPEKGL